MGFETSDVNRWLWSSLGAEILRERLVDFQCWIIMSTASRTVHSHSCDHKSGKQSLKLISSWRTITLSCLSSMWGGPSHSRDVYCGQNCTWNASSTTKSFSCCLNIFSTVCVHQLHSSGTDSYYDGLYPGHIPTTPTQKALLAVGSGVAALQNPYRHGETHAGMGFDSTACRKRLYLLQHSHNSAIFVNVLWKDLFKQFLKSVILFFNQRDCTLCSFLICHSGRLTQSHGFILWRHQLLL